jgi:hypothetical protein
MTPEERVERVQKLQENTQSVFNLLMAQQLTVEQGRVAADLLQLMTDLIDLSDTLAHRSSAR